MPPSSYAHSAIFPSAQGRAGNIPKISKRNVGPRRPGPPCIHCITWPHVLRGVHPESLDTDRDEVVDVIGYLLPDVVSAAVEIIEADEVAVPDLLGVVVVVYLAVWLMEVVIPEGHCRVGLSKRGRQFDLEGCIVYYHYYHLSVTNRGSICSPTTLQGWTYFEEEILCPGRWLCQS